MDEESIFSIFNGYDDNIKDVQCYAMLRYDTISSLVGCKAVCEPPHIYQYKEGQIQLLLARRANNAP